MVSRLIPASPLTQREQNTRALVAALSSSDTRVADMALCVLALADDNTPSGFSFLAQKKMPLSAGMTVAHLGTYIAEHGRAEGSRRSDREYVRDYVVKALLTQDIVELAVADGASGTVTRGQHNPKSGNNCYVLTTDARALVDLSASAFEPALRAWIAKSTERMRMADEKRLRAQAAGVAGSSHAQMIKKTAELLVENQGPLKNYEVVYMDLGDNSRIPEPMDARLKQLGVALDLTSKWPDLILYNPERKVFRIFDVVKSDGEMTIDRVDSINKSFAAKGLKVEAFTTVYADWASCAGRQGKERNLAPGSDLFILDDPTRFFSIGLAANLT